VPSHKINPLPFGYVVDNVLAHKRFPLQAVTAASTVSRTVPSFAKQTGGQQSKQQLFNAVYSRRSLNQGKVISFFKT
jgi:hypothetical protein